MDEDLELLLDFYNQEELELEQLVKNNVAEGDYQYALMNKRALNIVNFKLDVLNKLKDPKYLERINLERQKKNYSQLTKEEDNPLLRTYLEQRANEIKRKEEILNQTTIKPVIPGQELDDAFFDVIEGTIQSFKFYLRKKRNLYIEYKLIAKGKLKMSFTPGDQVEKDYRFTSYEERPLISMGFTCDEKEHCFSYVYNFTKFKSANFLKTLLARIVFDILNYQIDNPAIIVKEEFLKQ